MPVLLNPHGFAAPPAGLSYFDEMMADSPLVYWRRGDANGVTTMADSSGNSRNGTYYLGNVTVASLLINDADPAAARNAFIADAAWMDVSEITIQAIVRPNAGNNNRGIVSRFNSGQEWLVWANTSSKYAVRFYNTGGTQVNLAWATTPTINTTYHIAATYTSGLACLYIDGSLVDSSTALTGSLRTGSDLIEVGSYQNGGSIFSNAIDEVAIFGTARSAARIAAQYAAR